MTKFKLTLITLSFAFISPSFLPKSLKAQNVPSADSIVAAKEKKEETSGEKSKRKATYIIYTGVNFSSLSSTSDQVNTNSEIGFHLGAAYRSNGFFYWQVGA